MVISLPISKVVSSVAFLDLGCIVTAIEPPGLNCFRNAFRQSTGSFQKWIELMVKILSKGLLNVGKFETEPSSNAILPSLIALEFRLLACRTITSE
jgi:hypothetical protein